MKSLKSSAIWVSKPIEQDPSDEDWIGIEPLLEQKLKQLSISHEDSSTSELILFDAVKAGDSLLVVDIEENLYNVVVKEVQKAGIKYIIDISDYDFKAKPYKVWIDTGLTKIYVGLEPNKERLIWRDENITTKISNGTVNSFELYDSRKDLLLSGDIIICNGQSVTVEKINKQLMGEMYIFGDNSTLNDVIVDSNNNIVAVGKVDRSGYVVKIGENGNILWQKTVTGNNISFDRVSIDENDNIYILGSMNGLSIVMKMARDGNLLWARKMKTDVYGISVDTSGNILLSGSSYVLKFDSTGNLIWSKMFSTDLSRIYIYGIATDMSNNVYTATNIDLLDYKYAYVTKLTPNGDFQWIKGKTVPDLEICKCLLFDISANSTNNIVAVGYFLEGSMYIISIGSEGELNWIIFLNDENSYDNYMCRVSFDQNNNTLVSGCIKNGHYFLKIDTNGNILWQKSIVGVENISSITSDKNNNVLLVGTINNSGYIIKLNHNVPNIHFTNSVYITDASIRVTYHNNTNLSDAGRYIKVENGTPSNTFTSIVPSNIDVDPIIYNKNKTIVLINKNLNQPIKSVVIPDRTVPLSKAGIDLINMEQNIFGYKYKFYKDKKGRAILLKVISDDANQIVTNIKLDLYT